MPKMDNVPIGDYLQRDEADREWKDLDEDEKELVAITFSDVVTPILNELKGDVVKLQAKVEAMEVGRSSSIAEVESIEDFIDENELVILDFSAEWCVPCYYYLPALERMASKENGVAIGKVDVEEFGGPVERWFEGRMAIPLLLSFRDEEVIQRITGSRKGQKAHDIIRGMVQRLKVSEEQFEKKLRWAKAVADGKDWELNPNTGIRDSLIASLVNDVYCPCKVEDIPENVCPCEPVEGKYPGADRMMEEQGICFCGLFVDPDFDG